jgi:hypothetical protein
MDEYYAIECKITHGVATYRFVSLFNCARGPWASSEEQAKQHGEAHKKVVKRLYR